MHFNWDYVMTDFLFKDFNINDVKSKTFFVIKLGVPIDLSDQNPC
jgi:hypothetical protein